jgi:hypothetical protein
MERWALDAGRRLPFSGYCWFSGYGWDTAGG